MRGTECVTTHHRRAHRAAASRSRSTSSSSCARRPHLVRGRQDEGSGRACAARAEARWPGGEGLDVATRAIAQRRGAPARVARPLATSSRRRAAGGRRRARPLRVASVASCLEPSVESCQTHMGSSSATLARNIERRAPGERARAAWVWGGGAGRARTAAPPTPHSAPSRMCPISRVPGGGPPAVVHGAGGAARRGAACIRGQGQGRGGEGGAQRSPVQEANLRVDGRLHGALASSGELGGSARPISAAGTPLLQVYAGLFVSAAARARAQSFHAMETTVRLVARRMEHLLELTNTSAAPHDWHSGRLRPLEAKVDGPQVRSQPVGTSSLPGFF